MPRSLTILFSIAFTYFVLGEKTSKEALAACAIVVLGFLLGSVGNGSSKQQQKESASGIMKVAGIIFGLLSSVFVALYSIVMKKKMPVVGGNEWRLLNYNTLLSAILLVPVMFLAGEASVFSEPLLLNFRFWIDMVITGVFGYLISLAIFMQVKATSPLTIWGSLVSLINTVGIVLVIGGSFCYSYVRYKEMQARKAAAAVAAAMAAASPTPLAEEPTK